MASRLVSPDRLEGPFGRFEKIGGFDLVAHRMLLFGYGSLLNHDSVSRTLGRHVRQSDLIPAFLPGWYRTWTAAAPVAMNDQIHQALFLDLSSTRSQVTPSHPSDACNGIVLELSDTEFLTMDAREKGYRRVPCRVRVGEHEREALTYRVAEQDKTTEGIVLAKYLAIIRQGLDRFDTTFRQQYDRTTESPPRQIFKGTYQFCDRQQRQAVAP